MKQSFDEGNASWDTIVTFDGLKHNTEIVIKLVSLAHVHFLEKFIKCSIEPICKGADVTLFIFILGLVNHLLVHRLGSSCELEEQSKYLDLNSEYIVMSQLEESVHLFFQNVSELT